MTWLVAGLVFVLGAASSLGWGSVVTSTASRGGLVVRGEHHHPRATPPADDDAPTHATAPCPCTDLQEEDGEDDDSDDPTLDEIAGPPATREALAPWPAGRAVWAEAKSAAPSVHLDRVPRPPRA